MVVLCRDEMRRDQADQFALCTKHSRIFKSSRTYALTSPAEQADCTPLLRHHTVATRWWSQALMQIVLHFLRR